MSTMANLDPWQTIHTLCILGHLGMFIFGLIGFIFNDFGFDTPNSAVRVPWAASGVGIFGVQVNVVLFYLLQKKRVPLDRSLLHQVPVRLDSHPLNPNTPGANHAVLSAETPETVYFQTKVTVLVGSVLNVFFLGADWALASSGLAVDRKYSSFVLIFLCLIAIFAGAAALATIVADVLKVSRDRAHQREIEDMDVDDTDSGYRDEEEV